MTIVSKATVRKRSFAGNALATLVNSVCFLVAGVSAAAPSPSVEPFRAATILLGAACPSLSERPDLAIRFETDWLNAEAWRTAKAPWGPLVGAPVGIQVADPEELRRGGTRTGTHASAEMWLAADGGLITFRLGGNGTLVRGRDLEALEAKVLSAPDRSDELAQRLLVESRALYPPDQPNKARQRAESFLKAIEALVGNARITEIEFPSVPTPRPSNGRPWEDASSGQPSTTVSLKWSVRATTANTRLFFLIDPIQGNVVSLQAH